MSEQSPKTLLILASASPYRKLLLARLGIEFATSDPGIDESPLPGELPRELVARLAEQKACAVADCNPDAVVIGSDQLAVCESEILGKPGTRERAIQQLRRCSGREVLFHTAFCVLRNSDKFRCRRTVNTTVSFRMLDEAEIRRYVERENPVDCAGGFKAEAGGIALFERLLSDDPTALIGLPLIALSDALRKAGFEVP